MTHQMRQIITCIFIFRYICVCAWYARCSKHIWSFLNSIFVLNDTLLDQYHGAWSPCCSNTSYMSVCVTVHGNSRNSKKNYLGNWQFSQKANCSSETWTTTTRVFFTWNVNVWLKLVKLRNRYPSTATVEVHLSSAVSSKSVRFRVCLFFFFSFFLVIWEVDTNTIVW